MAKANLCAKLRLDSRIKRLVKNSRYQNKYYY